MLTLLNRVLRRISRIYFSLNLVVNFIFTPYYSQLRTFVTLSRFIAYNYILSLCYFE